ncbi:MAG: HDOD domain-containing protein [Verrucomicrobiota bacterium]
MKRLKSRHGDTAVAERPVAAAPDENAKLAAYVKSVRHLPPAPQLIGELLPLFNQPDRDVDRIVKLLYHDPAMTAEVLKTCNNSAFSGGEKCTDMFEAVMRLGLYEVFRIVIAVSGSHMISKSNAAAGLNVLKMWRHSVVCAVAASTIAARVHQPEASAFTAGLLHDVGRLVFASAEGIEYSRLLARAGKDRLDVVELERTVYGFDHAEMGAHLLRRWHLPEGIVGGVRFHHHPADAGDHLILAAVLHLANVFSHSIDDFFADPKVTLGNGTESSWLLRLRPAELPALLAATRKGLDDAKDLLVL